ncbi:MAG TPA: lipoprotein signal peptidase [Hanamia sp.]|nr:lipoprotein signal peptidase [Hanamia sp.]
MKKRTIFFIVCIIVIADQALKIYVKTHYYIGESHPVIGNWFKLYFIENAGMAYGWRFGGQWGKIILTLFRLAAVIIGFFYIKKIITKKYHPGYIICISLIFAGALGNLLDSLFYGMIFSNSSDVFNNIARIFPPHGYAGFLHGRVVDMLYFPIIHINRLPGWIPFFGGNEFSFFNYIFNIADASVSIGVISIILFRKHFFKPVPEKINQESEAVCE